MINIPQNAELVYISFSAEINPSTTEILINIMAECSNRNVQKVYLLFSTSGGSVMNGINLYNVLKGMPFELIIHNVGNIDSIGNAVFLASEQRYASPEATFMFHGVGFDSQPQERLEQKNLEEKLNNVLSDQRRIGSIIARHTNLNINQIATLFKQAQTKDVKYALDRGIIQDIREVQLTTGCPIISPIFKR